MNGLTSAQTLTAWEYGRGRHPIDRALTLLWAADPGNDYLDLARLPLGERNARLLSLHAASFGGQLHSRTNCPTCSQELEFSIDSSELLSQAGGAPDGQSVSADMKSETGDITLKFRLLNSLDLAAASSASSLADTRQVLIHRCLVEIVPPLETGQALPAALEAQLAGLLVSADPLADITIDLTCPNCGSAWQASLYPEQYLWDEIQNQARRLLYEVHQLALAYGWSESEILSLSPGRRQAYIDLIPTNQFNGGKQHG